MFSASQESKGNSSTGIGIYWGTFDPPTRAHENIIVESLKQLNLKKIIIVVNDNSNTKKIYKSPSKDRVKMLRVMFSSAELKDRVSIVKQDDKFAWSYSQFKNIYPEEKVFAIAGQDSFKSFGKFCGQYDHVVIIPRGDEADQLLQQIKDFDLINTSILEINKKFSNTSSTEVRDEFATNQKAMNDSLHPTVRKYAEDHCFFKGGYTSIHHKSAVKIQNQWRMHMAKQKSMDPVASSSCSSILMRY